jgi:hypothetical protein
MDTFKILENRVEAIEKRNGEVELNKAWETSLTRKFSIAAITYITVLLFFIVNKTPQPFISALVPTLGFLLSTLSVSFVKNIWIRRKK